ncbi:hypothetical protein H7169_02115 [Candidatus Gracilibacteria bacterium]|nr:hypothetical protein [Candidatus Gracilibacteria bacterium]
MNISTHDQKKNRYIDNKITQLVLSVEMLLGGIDQITPALRKKLKDYYETLKYISVVGKETIIDIMQVLKIEPIFQNSDAHFITTEQWCRIFLDMLCDRGIEKKLQFGSTVNTRVVNILSK